jgi:hypothetical protein
MGCNTSKPAPVEPDVLTLSGNHKMKSSTLPNDPSRYQANEGKTPSSPRQQESSEGLKQQQAQEQQQSQVTQGVVDAEAVVAHPMLDLSAPLSRHNGINGLNNNGFTGEGALPATASLAQRVNEGDLSGTNDPQWRQLWNTHKDMLLDPADVHATLQDLMAKFSNKLSETELLMLQRKVRSAVHKVSINADSIKRKTRKNSSVGSNSGGTNASVVFQDSSQHDPKVVVEKHHLLTPNVLRRVLPRPPNLVSNFQNSLSLTKSPSNDSNKSIGSLASENSSPEIRTIETTYLLALYCSDSLWDRVAEIAVQSAKANKLEMDVNKQTLQKQQQQEVSSPTQGSIPHPCSPTFERPPDTPPGVGLHALTFLLGLALRKYRSCD